jgi:hypothetical protein
MVKTEKMTFAGESGFSFFSCIVVVFHVKSGTSSGEISPSRLDIIRRFFVQ